VTVKRDGRSCYAVVATDTKGSVLTKVVAGRSATTEAVEEKAAPIQPIALGKAPAAPAPKLPMFVGLHASNSYAGDKGYGLSGYLYFATPEMGYRDGLQGVFAVREDRGRLVLSSIDAIHNPVAGPLNHTMETFWFGYRCVPQWADHPEERAYPFTENRMLWIIGWAVKKYDVDPNRIYAGGGSMGAWGSSTFAFRHPEIFAAVYPDRPRTRQAGLPKIAPAPFWTRPAPAPKAVMMDDGRTPYLERQDMVRFAAEHHEDLPAFIWCCGRNDGFASFKEQVDMVRALTASHHGFAFVWNDGGHGGGPGLGRLNRYYGPEKFARDRSYPAFGNSSLNDDLGSGELGADKKLKDGALEGGINLGFVWKDVVDEDGRWSVGLANDLAKAEMTVDVTPRRCQRFRPKPGEKLRWTSSAGGAGEVTADQWGLVTVEKVRIAPGAETTLTIAR
jgi:hypothetical protein